MEVSQREEEFNLLASLDPSPFVESSGLRPVSWAAA
jgi:hypothetical protein